MAQVAVGYLLTNLKDAHKYMLETMDGVTDEIAKFQPPHKANPIAGTYAHLLFSEDAFVHLFLQGKQPLFESKWKDLTGISELQPTEWAEAYPKWLRTVEMNVSKAHEYAKAVFSATEEYVAGLHDEDLAKEIDMSAFGMGTKSQGDFIAGMLTSHAYSIMGEVAVLKGIQGLKGYPF